MVKGFIERRVSQRVQFSVEIGVRLQQDTAEPIIAKTTDISAGGIQFSIPWGLSSFSECDKLELIFYLPETGGTIINAEIRHQHFGIDGGQNRLNFYGAKFIDLNLETWNSILNYCMAKSHSTSAPPNHILPEPKGLPITASLTAKVQLADGRAGYGLVEDISFGGVRLRVPMEIPVNSAIEVMLLTKDNQFKIDGSCVWTSEGKQDFISGIFFNRLDPEKFNQVRRLIFELARSVNLESKEDDSSEIS